MPSTRSTSIQRKSAGVIPPRSGRWTMPWPQRRSASRSSITIRFATTMLWIGSYYFTTPAAGGKVAKEQPTQVGRALAQLGIRHIPAYSPEARGRMERVFGTLQGRLPHELRLAGIATMEAANRFLAERFVPDFNARFAVDAAVAGPAFLP